MRILYFQVQFNFRAIKKTVDAELEKYVVEKVEKIGMGARYMCKFTGCSYRTNIKCNIKRHIRAHLKIKPYECVHCGYAATYQTNLWSHIHKHHQKPEASEVDEKLF